MLPKSLGEEVTNSTHIWVGVWNRILATFSGGRRVGLFICKSNFLCTFRLLSQPHFQHKLFDLDASGIKCEVVSCVSILRDKFNHIVRIKQ